MLNGLKIIVASSQQSSACAGNDEAPHEPAGLSATIRSLFGRIPSVKAGTLLVAEQVAGRAVARRS
jgi:hypothetical protein